MTTRSFFGSTGILATFAFMSLITLSASRTKAIRTGDSVDFGPPAVIKIVSLAFPSGFLVAFLLTLFQQPFEYSSLTFLFVGIFLFFGVPAELTVNAEEVREKFWWRRERVIRWKDVQKVNYNTTSGAVQIKSFDGRTINHSRINRDRDEFSQLCKKYTKSSNIR